MYNRPLNSVRLFHLGLEESQQMNRDNEDILKDL